MTNSTKEQRFAEFLKRLRAAPAAGSGADALELIGKTLNEVEDELTDIPFTPELSQTDGRMYPPQEDNVREVPGRDDLVRYRSRGHNTYVRANGAVEIRDLAGTIVISKPGSDNEGVELEL